MTEGKWDPAARGEHTYNKTYKTFFKVMDKMYHFIKADIHYCMNHAVFHEDSSRKAEKAKNVYDEYTGVLGLIKAMGADAMSAELVKERRIATADEAASMSESEDASVKGGDDAGAATGFTRSRRRDFLLAAAYKETSIVRSGKDENVSEESARALEDVGYVDAGEDGGYMYSKQ